MLKAGCFGNGVSVAFLSRALLSRRRTALLSEPSPLVGEGAERTVVSEAGEGLFALMPPHPDRARIPSARSTFSHQGRRKRNCRVFVPHQFNCQTKDATHRPYSLSAPGAPFRAVRPARRKGERSAGKRGGLRHLLSGWRSRPTRSARRVLSVAGGEAPPGAPLGGVLCPRRPCFRAGHRKSRSDLSIRAAPAALRVPLVQPFKAAPHSGGGRLAGASRARGYEPRPQAPRPTPPSFASRENAPSSGWDEEVYSLIGILSIGRLCLRR